MRLSMRSFVLACLIGSAFAASRSIWDGVYSDEQAARGKKAYNAQCARCHGEALLGGEGSPALVDQEFLEKWNEKPLGSLVERTRKTMPSDGPGRLSRRVCTDIVTYLLSANGFPAGKAELEPDPALQDEILIQPKK
jgi:mono/diheme cytochrome c family protein